MNAVATIQRMCRVEGLPGATVAEPSTDLALLGIIAVVSIPYSGVAIPVVDGFSAVVLRTRATRSGYRWEIDHTVGPLEQQLRLRHAALLQVIADIHQILTGEVQSCKTP